MVTTLVSVTSRPAAAPPSNAQLLALLDGQDQPLLVIDARARLSLANRAAQQLLGCLYSGITTPTEAAGVAAAYEYEPGQHEILDEMVPRFTALQVYQAVLESQASEHAARMIAMRNATDNAKELVGALQLAYNKVRQQAITNDILDIVGGANALAEN